MLYVTKRERVAGVVISLIFIYLLVMCGGMLCLGTYISLCMMRYSTLCPVTVVRLEIVFVARARLFVRLNVPTELIK